MKEVRRFKWPALLFLFIGILALAACGNTGITDDNNNDNVEGRVAGANQQAVYGYIIEVNDQARTVLVDEFNLVSANDTDQIRSLNLDRDRDFVNGYYINDTARVKRLYPLATTADLKISNYDYSASSFYNQRWGVGNVQGLSSDLSNNNTTLDNNNISNNNTTQPNQKGNNAPVIDNDNITNKAQAGATENIIPDYYKGGDFGTLRDRMTAYEHVPFMLTLENGKVVKIEEIDYLYYNNNNAVTNNNNNAVTNNDNNTNINR